VNLRGKFATYSTVYKETVIGNFSLYRQEMLNNSVNVKNKTGQILATDITKNYQLINNNLHKGCRRKAIISNHFFIEL
jgi:hypothetical protein